MAYSEEIITQTRQHFADIHRQCITDILENNKVVNNLESHLAFREKTIASFLAGDYDNTIPFQQYAHYLESGECVAILL